MSPATVTKPQTMEEALGKQAVEEVTHRFPAVAVFEKEGEFLIGTYQGSEIIKPNGKDMRSHRLLLRNWSCRFQLAKKEHEPVEGDLVSISGRVVDDTLTDANIGQTFGVEFVGYGARKPGQNPARLYKIVRVGTEEVEA